MGQPDLASNSLTSHADVFADIVNAIVYEGKTVLAEQHLKPFYLKSTVEKTANSKDYTETHAWRTVETGSATLSGDSKTSTHLTLPLRLKSWDTPIPHMTGRLRNLWCRTGNCRTN